MANLQTFLWLMQTADLLPAYPESADPVEKHPNLLRCQLAALPTVDQGPTEGNSRQSSMGPGTPGCDEWGLWLPWDSTGYFVGN